MKSIPLNGSYKIESFLITSDIIDRGYYIMDDIPILESVKLTLSEKLNIIHPQYYVTDVDEDLEDFFPDAEIGQYVLSWMMFGYPSATVCYTPDPLWGLGGTLYDILYDSIGDHACIKYVTQN
jgi:hypothetical protein